MDPIKSALREAATELTRLALERGSHPPAEVLPDVIKSVEHIACLNCDAPLLNRAPYRHLATAKTECEETVTNDLTDEEQGLFLAVMEAMALGYAGLSKSIGLMRGKMDGEDVAVIVGVDVDDDDSPLWPIAVLVDSNLIDRLEPPTEEAKSVVMVPPGNTDLAAILAALTKGQEE